MNGACFENLEPRLLLDADLALSVGQFPADGVYSPGDALAVTITITNAGDVNTGDLDYPVPWLRPRPVLSLDQTYQDTDVRLGIFDDNPALAPSEAVTRTLAGVIPADTPAGNYYFGVDVETLQTWRREPLESNLANNAAFTATAGIAIQTDLAIDCTAYASGTFGIGDVIATSIAMSVPGAAGISANTPVTIEARLSPDQVWGNTGDVVIYSQQVTGGMAAGGGTASAINLTVPAGIDPGSYYLGWRINTTNSIPETDGGPATGANNTWWSDAADIFAVTSAVGVNGTANDIQYDATGDLHFAWFERSAGYLKYAVQDAGAGNWGPTTVVDAGSDEVGQYVSMAVDSAGNPGLAYYDAHNADLKYAHYNGAGWDIETVQTQNRTGLYPSLAYNGADQPVIAYYKSTGGYLMMAANSGAAWAIEVVDGLTEDVGRYPSLALSPVTGRWGIAYEDTTFGQFKYAEQNAAGGWDLAVYDAATINGGGYTSLAFDAGGNPAVSYYDAHVADLKFARRSAGGVWSAESVALRRSQGLYTSLFFGAGGEANIAFYNKTTDNLVLATENIGGWGFRTLVTGAGREAKIAINPLQPLGAPGGLTATWFMASVGDLGVGTVI